MLKLILFRHAKAHSDSASGLDHDRALTHVGRIQAAKMATVLAGWLETNSVVLLSSSTRTVETWSIVAEEHCSAIPAVIVPELYLASCETIIDTVRKLAGTAETVVVVGHNPGLERMVSQAKHHDLKVTGMPTASIALLTIDHSSWQTWDDQPTILIDLKTPHDV